MRWVDPAFPDLIPVQYRFGSVPDGPGTVLDPVQMRVPRGVAGHGGGGGPQPGRRRPVSFLVHGAVARERCEELTELLESGSGALLVQDDLLEDLALPPPRFEAQIVVLGVWLPAPWGNTAVPNMGRWRELGIPAGVLLGLAPAPDGKRQVTEGVHRAFESGATFAIAAPLSPSPQDRQRLWESHADQGDTALEDLLFHTDLTDLALDLERACSRACAELGMAEGLPGPATATLTADTSRVANSLLLWARRLDLLDGVSSQGWKLRRAARALVSSGKRAGHLLAEDNLRVIPGFDSWVEAFARSLCEQRGQPFGETRRRWLQEA